MKKILLLLIAITFSTNLYADKLLKDGFLNNKMSYEKDQNINDPTNKIILIYNHGQKTHDGKSSDCVWKNGIRNFSSLVGEKVEGKEIMVYLLCTGKLAGDDKRLWNKKKFKPSGKKTEVILHAMPAADRSDKAYGLNGSGKGAPANTTRAGGTRFGEHRIDNRILSINSEFENFSSQVSKKSEKCLFLWERES